MSSQAGNGSVLIVGLGNPGLKFELTRHNAGFKVIDSLAGDTPWKNEAAHHALIAHTTIVGQHARLLKPQTFMNRSGQAVQSAAAFFKIPNNRIIIIHDDADLPFGEVHSKFGGGTAGHNGLQSIVDRLGTPDVWRVRMGIGRDPNPNIELETFVLNPWTEPERAALEEIVSHAVHTVEEIVVGIDTSS